MASQETLINKLLEVERDTLFLTGKYGWLRGEHGTTQGRQVLYILEGQYIQDIQDIQGGVIYKIGWSQQFLDRYGKIKNEKITGSTRSMNLVPENIIMLAYMPFLSPSTEVKRDERLRPTDRGDYRETKRHIDKALLTKINHLILRTTPKSEYFTLKPNFRIGRVIQEIIKQIKEFFRQGELAAETIMWTRNPNTVYHIQRTRVDKYNERQIKQIQQNGVRNRPPPPLIEEREVNGFARLTRACEYQELIQYSHDKLKEDMPELNELEFRDKYNSFWTQGMTDISTKNMPQWYKKYTKLPFRTTRLRNEMYVPYVLTHSAYKSWNDWAEMPPNTPPALLVKKPSGVIRSRCSEPRRSTTAIPSPISTPFTAFIDINEWAISASKRSNTGSPQPGGKPSATTVKRAPIESSSRLN